MRTVTECLVHAISVRDEVDKGTQSQEWVRDEVLGMVEEGFWNDSQIAEIVTYARQSVSKMARGAQRPSKRPAGGRLARGSLDVLLELRGAISRGSEPNASMLRAAINTKTSTKLISRLTGCSLGVILYQQRKMRDENEIEGWVKQ